MFKLIPILILQLILNHSSSLTIKHGKNWIDRQEVQLREDYKMGWEVDLENEEIIFDVTVQTTGFVGFGLNSNGGMRGADIIIGGVGHEGPYFEDRHGTQNGLPPIDTVNDYTLLEATEESGTTFLKFSRKLNTCDMEDHVINENTIRVIWSIGATDELNYHGSGNRGSLSLIFLDGPKPPFNPDLFNKWEVRVNDVMPSDHTSYMCTMHRMPNLSNKHHIIAFDAFLPNADAIRHTHHFTAMKCTPPVGQDPDEFFGKYVGQPAGECEGGVPTEFSELKQYCQDFFYIWAVGGQMLIFPDNAGYPISELNSSDYVLLEIHYDNPEVREGIQYTTGFNAYYTENLREQDAEMLIMGLDVFHSQVIPPNTEKFISPGHCAPACTNLIDPAGINIFAYMFHSHLAGREMKWRVFRDDVELPWPATDFQYDFNFQQIRNFREPFRMMPGDHTVVECTYSTTGRNVITKGGFSSMEEMCQVMAYYYPRLRPGDLKYCTSQTPATPEYYGLFGIEEVDMEANYMDPIVTKPEKFAGLSFSQVLNDHVEWTPELREAVRKIQYEDPHMTSCGMDPPDKPVSYPNVTSYIPPDQCEIEGTSTTTTEHGDKGYSLDTANDIDAGGVWTTDCEKYQANWSDFGDCVGITQPLQNPNEGYWTACEKFGSFANCRITFNYNRTFSPGTVLIKNFISGTGARIVVSTASNPQIAVISRNDVVNWLYDVVELAPEDVTGTEIFFDLFNDFSNFYGIIVDQIGIIGS